MTGRSGRRPACDWFDGLDKKGLGQFYAAIATMETSLDAGRPSKRFQKVRGSKQKLWELRVTMPGSSAPHLRLLYRREGKTLWVAVGFTKQKNRLERSDIQQGDNITQEWLEGRRRAT
jgi:Phage derived protein Gp49-like (DUF891)